MFFLLSPLLKVLKILNGKLVLTRFEYESSPEYKEKNADRQRQRDLSMEIMIGRKTRSSVGNGKERILTQDLRLLRQEREAS